MKVRKGKEKRGAKSTPQQEEGLTPFLKKVLIILGIGIGLLLILLVLLAVFNRRTQIVGLNQEIQYDDFAFSVLGVRKAKSLGEGAASVWPSGSFYIVTLRIANHAKRVDYKFNRSYALFIDDFGNEHALAPSGQAALDSEQSSFQSCSTPLPAGTDCVTEIVFDAPDGLKRPALRISEAGLIGDLLDTIVYGRKRIDLYPLD